MKSNVMSLAEHWLSLRQVLILERNDTNTFYYGSREDYML